MIFFILISKLRTIRGGSRLVRNSRRQRREQVLSGLTGVLSHEGIHNDKGGHSLNNGDSAGHDARIVTTLSLKDTLLESVSSSVLSLTNSSGRLESDAEVNVGAVGDTALNTTGVVGLGGKTLGAVLVGGNNERVVVNGTSNLAAAETGADLEALGGGDAEHGVRELGLELIEAGLAQADGYVTNHTCDGSTNAVVTVPELLNDLGHACAGLGLRAADGGELVNGFAVNGLQQLQVFRVGRGSGVFGGRREEVLVAHGGDEGDDLDTVRQTEVLLSNGTGGDTTW